MDAADSRLPEYIQMKNIWELCLNFALAAPYQSLEKKR